MQQKQYRFGLSRAATGMLLVVVMLTIVLAILVAGRMRTDAAPATQKAPRTAASQFSFGGAAGWRQGPSNNTSMALFHDSDCFTAIEYKAGSVDSAAARQKIYDMLVTDGYTLTPVATQSVGIQTAAGQQHYDLYTTAVVDPSGANNIKGGQAIGYLPLPDGYIEIEGYCDTPEQLPVLIPALQAYTFSAGK